MKILFTGASSFTGYWFARELCLAGHDVTAIFQGDAGSYSGVRKVRIDELAPSVDTVWGCSFGDDRFFDVLAHANEWDLLCHHAADVRDYKSSDFEVVRALEANTRQINTVLAALEVTGCARILVTGSVFEGGEGAGSDALSAFSPYGLSKQLSWELIKYYAMRRSMGIGKFVIPNPFGPYEDARFTAYLMNTWAAGEAAMVRTPDYIRDNIHVSLLAKAYRAFAESVKPSETRIFHPSGYIESQGQFTHRIASEIRKRTPYDCKVSLATQTEFSEPKIRINTDPVSIPGWSESQAWDEFASYYQELRGRTGQ